MKQLKINGFDIETSFNIDEFGGTEAGVYYSAKKLYESIGKVENLRISRFLECKEDGVTYAEKYKGRYYRTNKITYMFCKELFIKYATWINKELGRLIKECIESESDSCSEVDYEINKPVIKKEVKEVEVNEVPTVAKVDGKKSYECVIGDKETPTHFDINLKNVKSQTNDEQSKEFETLMVEMIGKSIENNEFDFAKQLFGYMTNKIGLVSQNVPQEQVFTDEQNQVNETMTDVLNSLGIRKFELDKLKKLDDKEKFKLIRQYIKEAVVQGNDFQKMMEVYNTSDIAKQNNVVTKDLYAMLNKLGVVKHATNCQSWVFNEPKKYEKLATIYKSYHQETNTVRSYTIKWNGGGRIFVEKFIEMFFQ